MKIALVWWFDQASEIFPDYRDGVRGAVDIIKKSHTVDWFLDKDFPEPGDYDFILFWSSTNEDYFELLDGYEEPKGLLLTTDPHFPENLRKMDVVYCESDPILHAVRSENVYALKAFGTDTDYFKPDPKKEKDIEYFFPATFSPWKRQDEIADYGDRLLCVGTVQPDGEHIYQKCLDRGVKCEVGYFPVKKIREYYQRAKNVPIPSIHGSERTVLEAMATNILPNVIHPTNRRTYSYIKEFEESGIDTPRKFVLKNYSHKVYAKQIMRGIKNVRRNNARLGNRS